MFCSFFLQNSSRANCCCVFHATTLVHTTVSSFLDHSPATLLLGRRSVKNVLYAFRIFVDLHNSYSFNASSTQPSDTTLFPQIRTYNFKKPPVTQAGYVFCLVMEALLLWGKPLVYTGGTTQADVTGYPAWKEGSWAASSLSQRFPLLL